VFALSCRGDTLRGTGQVHRALTDLDRALHLRPGDPFALRRRAAVHLALDDPISARLDVDEAVRREPEDDFARRLRALVEQAERRLFRDRLRDREQRGW
jgi:regulator of sirC expression with transglutaminase-like and TPR domain